MGLIHHGWVEAREFDHWYIVFYLDFASANPALLGDLFGIGDQGRFAPMIPERGKPDYTHQYKPEQEQRLIAAGVAHTWMTAAEVAAIDWDEAGTAANGRTSTRGDAVDPRWHTVFKLMEDLSTRYPPENVRMVIWFTMDAS